MPGERRLPPTQADAVIRNESAPHYTAVPAQWTAIWHSWQPCWLDDHTPTPLLTAQQQQQATCARLTLGLQRVVDKTAATAVRAERCCNARVEGTSIKTRSHCSKSATPKHILGMYHFHRCYASGIPGVVALPPVVDGAKQNRPDYTSVPVCPILVCISKYVRVIVSMLCLRWLFVKQSSYNQHTS